MTDRGRERAIGELSESWDRLGRRSPMRAILNPGGWGPEIWDRDAFFATGRKEIEAALDWARRCGAEPARGRALDFGCGAGRLTQALAERFESACGLDIAASMIELARSCNRHGERCRYLHNVSERLEGLADGEFDFVYSSITLQHVDPRLVPGYLREFLRVLAPGGALLFQLPAAPSRSFKGRLLALSPRWLMRLYGRLRRGSVTEVHGVPREGVVRILEEAGAELVAVEADSSAGPQWLSFRYLARKPSPRGPRAG